MKHKEVITCQNIQETVKYRNKEYKVQSDSNGFKYIKPTVDGNRVIMPVIEVDKEFDYIFNFGWRK